MTIEGERPVHDLVERMRLGQPQVSKHLRVLREVELVDVRDEGRQRFYRLDPRPRKPIHDWLSAYTRMWDERFDAMDVVVEELKGRHDGSGQR